MAPEQIQRLEEMALWLIRHPEVEESLCAECFSPEGDEMLEVLRALKERGYYELAMIFMMRSQVSREAQRAIERFCTKHLIKEAGRIGIHALLEDYEGILADEIEQRKERVRQRTT